MIALTSRGILNVFCFADWLAFWAVIWKEEELEKKP